MTMVFVSKEHKPGETRVAAVPDTVRTLVKLGLDVAVERGAGAQANFSDQAYADAGAAVVDAEARSGADIHLSVAPPSPASVESLREGAVALGFLGPFRNLELVRQLAERKISSISVELVPRITRAQSMDALSSQASIGGYKAVLLAALHLDRYTMLLMTAAGTVKPARFVIMGAGVAGLQAVATARRLGAIVEVSDIRPAVKEEVESLGGRFIELPMAEDGAGSGGYAKQMSEEFLRKQREIVARHVAGADVVITTALVPGKPAPKLVSDEMVASMRPGAVIVDMAVEEGGNCTLSKKDETVVSGGVTILGPSNLPALMPYDASALYARNLLHLIELLWKDKQLGIDLGDEILAGAVLTHAGEVRHPLVAQLLGAPTA
jgi:NAD(P) transhydrogenase subunit alpha